MTTRLVEVDVHERNRLCLDCDELIDYHRASPPVKHFRDGCYVGGTEYGGHECGYKPVLCNQCDGVGWIEGGKTLQTTCDHCDGTGWEPVLWIKREVPDVVKIDVVVPATDEMIRDAPRMRETMAILSVLLSKRLDTRYHNVWRDGYREALEDVRKGRLKLNPDGHFDL